MAPLIRPARAEDAPAVASLASQLAQSYRFDPAGFEANYPALLATPDVRLLVAVVDQRPGGYLLGHQHLTLYANGPVATVDEMLVREDVRGGGLGRALLASFEAWAARRGCARVAVATRRAGAFYQACGYQDSALYLRKELLA
jgi:GNAT superfamily N-acetyltransferase